MSTATSTQPQVVEDNNAIQTQKEEQKQSAPAQEKQENNNTNTKQDNKQKKKPQRKPVNYEEIPKDKKQLKKYIAGLEKKFGSKSAPDAKKKQAKVTQIENKITKQQELIAKIKDKMDKQKEQWPEQAKKIELQKQIDELSKKMEASKLDGKMKMKHKKVEGAIANFQAAVKTKNEFKEKTFVNRLTKLEDIEKKIKEYTHTLNTEAPSREEENRLVKLISKLEISRNQIPKLKAYDDKIDQMKAKINDAKKERSEFKAQMDTLYKQRRDLIKERDENSKELHKKLGSKKSDYQRMKDAKQQIGKLYKEKSAVFKAFHSKGDEYYGMQRQLRAAKGKLRELEEAERRAEREAEREKKRQDNLKKAKLYEEMRLKEEAEEAAKAKAEAESKAQEEREIKLFELRNPYDAELSLAKPLLSYVANLSKGKKRRRGRGGAFKHDFGKMTAFQDLGIPIPLNASSANAAQKLLKERIKFWQEETKKVAEKELPPEEPKKEEEAKEESKEEPAEEQPAQEEKTEEAKEETQEEPAEEQPAQE